VSIDDIFERMSFSTRLKVSFGIRAYKFYDIQMIQKQLLNSTIGSPPFNDCDQMCMEISIAGCICSEQRKYDQFALSGLYRVPWFESPSIP